MAKFNIFKIDRNKHDKFLEFIYPEIASKTIRIDDVEYKVTLCGEIEPKNARIGWQFILNQFDMPVVVMNKQPKGILYLEINGNIYAATFGPAFNIVEKYCDRDFAFKVARKFTYEKIKSTSVANPNSNKNKVINSYLDSEYFEYDSGAAFLKIKAKLKLDEEFQLFEKNIEIGTSIKLNTSSESLDGFIKIIIYLDNVLHEVDKTPIPVFQEIKDLEEINELNEKLKEDTTFENMKISFSDFDIIGTTEVFYSQGTEFCISYKHYRKNIDYLDMDAIKQFCDEKSLELKDVFFDIYVKIKDDSNRFEKVPLVNFIDCTINEKGAVLINGKWYKYNRDYLVNLNKSLKDLTCEHLLEFDFCQDLYDEYIDKKLIEEKNELIYRGKTDEEIKCLLKKKYYKERVYNKLMADIGNYENGDRSLVKIDGSKIEVDDLYKDNTIYAVKIGNSSSKLCYVVDQIDLAMRLIKSNEIQYAHDVKTIALVLIIDKHDNYPESDGLFDITNLKYIALKNTINNWQKQARLMCYTPRVIIGYNR